MGKLRPSEGQDLARQVLMVLKPKCVGPQALRPSPREATLTSFPRISLDLLVLDSWH